MKGMIIQHCSEVYNLILFPLARMSPMGLETNEEEVEVHETGFFVVMFLVVRRKTKQQ